ncbi:dynein light chain LC8-type, variant [Fonticula alba]|nr:dynein light chain LC8-type, variant [Fonticula alba]KCV68281.1 dynein light chain LC8-type, variant [Fonticula alba]|eukprot:XP_009497335.1 dynein light chain LC8-type, variant [Fonticula alba]
MSDEFRAAACEVAIEAITSFKLEREIAAHIKKTFDQRYGKTWHCIVGKSFGSYVSHDSRHFIFMQIDRQNILLFKSG